MLELEEDWEIGDEDMEVGVADVRPDVENTVEVGRGLEVVGTEVIEEGDGAEDEGVKAEELEDIVPEETTDEGGVELGVTGAVLVGDETDELVDKDEGIVENGCRLRGRLIGCDEVVVGLSDKIEPGSVRRIPLRPGKSPLRSSSPAGIAVSVGSQRVMEAGHGSMRQRESADTYLSWWTRR